MTTLDKQSNTIIDAGISVLFSKAAAKSYSDAQDRKTLQYLYNLAHSIISHFEGKIIRYIDNFILAYFNNPEKALKAAIFLQKKMQIYNKKNINQPVAVTTGIQQIKTKIDDYNLYGDAMNFASQLEEFKDKNEIYVSKDFYDLVKNTTSVYFESTPIIYKNELAFEITYFKVSWDDKLELSDDDTPVICIHLIPQIADSNFLYLWKDFIQSTSYDTLDKKLKNKKIILNDYILLNIVNNINPVDIIKDILSLFSDKTLAQESVYPIQIAIDTNSNFPNQSIPDWLEECIKEMSLGCIYISNDIYFVLNNIEHLNLNKVTLGPKKKKFYRMIYLQKFENYSVYPFSFSYALVFGNNNPCFYCGSKKHKNSECPSKKLIEYTHSIAKLGYLSFEKINSSFLKIILNIENKTIDEYKIDTIPRIAYESFFELTRIYQIRFLMSIWSTKSDNWLVIRESKGSHSGGLAWIAMDAIRMSNYEKALESIKKIEEERYDIFKLYCIYGFFYIEKEDYIKAEDYFKRALAHVKEEIYKTYLKLLISRIYFIQNRIDEAINLVEDIIYKDNLCVDAIYFDIVLCMRRTNDAKLLKKMTALLERNKEFFIYIYIDPEFSYNQDIVLEKLNVLFSIAKKNAEEAFYLASSKFNHLAESLNKETISDIQSSFFKARDAMSSESYFGYLDAKYYFEDVIMKCTNFLKNKRIEVEKQLINLLNHTKINMNFYYDFKYKRIAIKEKTKLVEIHSKINKTLKTLDTTTIKDLEGIKKFYDDIKKQLGDIEVRISSLAFLDKSIASLSTFGKLASIFLACLLILCFLIIPVLSKKIEGDTTFGNIIYELFFNKEKIFLWGSKFCFLAALIIAVRKFLKHR